MKKNKIILFVLLSIVLGGSYIGIKKYRTTAAPPVVAPIWVKAVPVKHAAIPIEINTIGTLTARSVDITSEVAGHVKSINFKDGQPVKAGEVILQLDDAIYKTKHELAKAKFDYSATNLNRMRTLSKRGMITKLALEQAEAEYKERKADVEETEAMLNKMKLVAPFSGVLGQRKVQQGHFLSVGQPIVTLTDMQHLHVEYSLPEKYLAALKIGQQVSITSSAYPQKTFIANLAYISPTVNPANRSISVYAHIDNNHLLASGMFVNIAHTLATKETVLMIAARSLMPVLDGEQVYKVINGKAILTTVKIGRRLANEIQIVDGLNVGDMVITDGQNKIRNGLPVNLAKE